MKVHWSFILMNSRIKEGEPMGVIVQKKDGGFLYTTTDIARRLNIVNETLKADRALVFSDTRQSQHMQQAWLIYAQSRLCARQLLT